MESKAIIIKLLESLTSQIDSLSESDLLKIKAETHELTIQLKKNKSIGGREMDPTNRTIT